MVAVAAFIAASTGATGRHNFSTYRQSKEAREMYQLLLYSTEMYRFAFCFLPSVSELDICFGVGGVVAE